MQKLRLALAAALFAAGVSPVRGQETASANRFTTEHYFELERVNSPQISPDGARIVYAREQANRLEDRWEPPLWIINADGSQHRFLAKGSSARWAPDSKRILYLADGELRGTQVFVRWIDAEGPAKQITHATEKIADARWSPDGKQIAFVVAADGEAPRQLTTGVWSAGSGELRGPVGMDWTPGSQEAWGSGEVAAV